MTRIVSWCCSLFALGAMLLMVGVFAWESWPVWQHAGASYVTGDQWFFRSAQFGAWPMIYGTIAVAVIALLIAAPLGIGTAIFIAEYLPQRLRFVCKVLIELLAGIPSVVYGLLGILLLREWVYEVFARFEPLSGDTLLTAGLLLGIMLLPTIATLTDDALRTIPSAHRQAARALGLTRGETIWAVCLRQSARGIGAAILLALGRALGETVAVFLVVGRQDNNLPANWLSPRAMLEAGQTLTTKLGGSETNIAYGGPLHWGAIMGLGLLLLVITGVLTLLASAFQRNRHA